MVELTDLLLIERKHNLAVSTVLTNDVEKAETYVVDAVLTVEHIGNCKCGIDTGKEALADVANGHGNSVVGCALSLDNACTGLSYVLLNVILFKIGVDLVCLREKRVTEVLNGNVRDVGDGPRNKLRFSVLTENICVNVVQADLVVLSKS